MCKIEKKPLLHNYKWHVEELMTFQNLIRFSNKHK